MDLIAIAFRNAQALDAHERRVRLVSIPEVDFIEGLPFESGCPVWFNLPVFGLFGSGGNSVEINLHQSEV
jgi:hypothetical protein